MVQLDTLHNENEEKVGEYASMSGIFGIEVISQDYVISQLVS